MGRERHYQLDVSQTKAFTLSWAIVKQLQWLDYMLQLCYEDNMGASLKWFSNAQINNGHHALDSLGSRRERE